MRLTNYECLSLKLEEHQVGEPLIILTLEQVNQLLIQMRVRGLANKKFDLNLPEGKVGEKFAEMILEGRLTCEVRRDIRYDDRGNIAIEYEDRGKPSGINVTTAQWWCHWLGIDNDTAILVKTKTLKNIAERKKQKHGLVYGGDDNAAGLVLMKPWELIKSPEGDYYRHQDQRFDW